MKLTKVMNKDMEVAIVEGGMMIGRCRGPIKAILPTYEEKIAEVIGTAAVKEEEIVEVVEEDIDMEDYKLFCDWMIANGGEPSIEEYKNAMAYYSAI